MKVKIEYINDIGEVIARDEFEGLSAQRQFTIYPILEGQNVLVGYQLQTIVGVPNQAKL